MRKLESFTFSFLISYSSSLIFSYCSSCSFLKHYLCCFMNLFTGKAVIIITCPKRLTPWLEQEIKELGFSTEETFVTGIKLSGTINDCIKLNLNLRCASQVLYKLKQF